MKFSDQIREKLAAEVGPCPACGKPKATITELAAKLEQPASSVGRYLAGGKPSVGLLDAAQGMFVARSEALLIAVLDDAEPPDEGATS